MALVRSKVALKFEQTADRQVNQLQENANAAGKALNRMPMLNGITTDSTVFTGGGTVQIFHRLGYVPKGWVCIDVITGDGTFRRTAWDSNSISIRSANACTAIFLVF